MALLVKLVVGIAALGALAWGIMSYQKPVRQNMQTNDSQKVQDNAQVSGNADSQISVSGSSDAQLSADLNMLDTQLQAASNDSASIDEGMNDKPIEQTE